MAHFHDHGKFRVTLRRKYYAAIPISLRQLLRFGSPHNNLIIARHDSLIMIQHNNLIVVR